MGQNIGTRDNKGRVVVTKKHVIGIAIGILFIVFLCLLGKIGEDVKTEQIVVNQRPFSGHMEYWTDPGFKWQMFGRTKRPSSFGLAPKIKMAIKLESLFRLSSTMHQKV